jgi:hypothetical protein
MEHLQCVSAAECNVANTQIPQSDATWHSCKPWHDQHVALFHQRGHMNEGFFVDPHVLRLGEVDSRLINQAATQHSFVPHRTL